MKDLLERHFDTAFAARDGIKKLRELILTLAMQGKLVPQDPKDPPASKLLKELELTRRGEYAKGELKRTKELPEIKLEELPYELPEGWEWVRLGQLASIQTGKKDVNQGHENGEYPFFSCAAEPLKSNEYSFDREALLLPGNGANVGLVTRYIGKFEAYQRTYVISDFCLSSSEYIEKVLKAHFLKSIEGKQYGSAINYIKLGNLTDFLIPLPPPTEQNQIVVKINQLMARCDELEKLRAEREQKRLAVHTAVIKQLLDAQEQDSFTSAWQFITRHFGELYTVKENVAELRKAILQLAVMGKLVPQDPNDPPASELLKEIEAEKRQLVKQGKIKKSEPLPEIKSEEVPCALPVGWEWVRLDSITSKITDGDHKTPPRISAGFRLLSAKNVRDGHLDFENCDLISEEHYMKSRTRCLPESGDLLIVSVGGTIGRTSLIPEDSAFALVRSVALIKPLLINSSYLKYSMDSELLQASIHERKRGGAQPCLYLSEIQQFPFSLPPLPEQLRIVAKIDQLMSLCDTLDQEIDASTGKQTELLNAVMAQAS